MPEPADLTSDGANPSSQQPPAPSIPAGRVDRFLGALLDFLSSIWLAVLLLTLILVVSAVATFLEARVDAGFARFMVYDRPWFEFLLSLLGLNIVAAALMRWPWKRRHTGFLITHLGLVVVLMGAAVGRYLGWEGQLALMEGETGNEVRTAQQLLRVSTPSETRVFDVQFKYDPPGPQRPQRLACGPYAVTILKYLPQAELQELVRPGGDGGSPAVKVRLTNQFGQTETWLLLDDAERSERQVGPATVRFVRADSDSQLRELTSRTAAEPPGDTDALEVQLLTGERLTVPIAAKLRQKIPLRTAEASLTVLERYRNATAKDNVSGDGPCPNPALKFRLHSPQADKTVEEDWLFYYLPFRRAIRRLVGTWGLADIEIRLAETDEERDAWLNPAGFLKEHPDGQLLFRSGGTLHTLCVAKTLGRKTPVGETGIELEILHFYPCARVNPETRKIENASAKPTNPALHFKAKGPAGEEERWVFGDFPNFEPMASARKTPLVQDARLLLPRTGGNRLVLVCGPSERLAYRLSSDRGDPVSGPLEVGKPVKTNWGGLELVVDSFLPRAVNRVVLAESQDIGPHGANPAVRFRIETPTGTGEYVAYGSDYSKPFDTFPFSAAEATGIRQIDYRVRDLAERNAGNLLTLVRAPDGSLHYVARSATGAQAAGRAEPGKEIPLPWEQDSEFSVEASLEDGVAGMEVAEAPGGDARYLPAAQALISKGSEVAEGWVWWGDMHGTDIAVGTETVSLALYDRTVPLEFDVGLLDFRAVPNPGGAGVASFESDVEILDAAQGVRKEARISMNRPLRHRGILFCQSSYVKAEKPGDPDMSVLSVSYDPGLRVVYAGCVLVMLGMAVTFYIKPKRQRLGWRWEI